MQLKFEIVWTGIGQVIRLQNDNNFSETPFSGNNVNFLQLFVFLSLHLFIHLSLSLYLSLGMYFSFSLFFFSFFFFTSSVSFFLLPVLSLNSFNLFFPGAILTLAYFFFCSYERIFKTNISVEVN